MVGILSQNDRSGLLGWEKRKGAVHLFFGRKNSVPRPFRSEKLFQSSEAFGLRLLKKKFSPLIRKHYFSSIMAFMSGSFSMTQR